MALKTTIHNIAISLRVKENFTCCGTKCPGRRVCSERTQISSTHSQNVKRKVLVYRYHLRVPCHKSGKRGSNVVGRHGNKLMIRLTGYGRSADLIEQLRLQTFKITSLHLFRQLQGKRPSEPLRWRDGRALSPAFA
jgi:hypothetical protein